MERAREVEHKGAAKHAAERGPTRAFGARDEVPVAAGDREVGSWGGVRAGGGAADAGRGTWKDVPVYPSSAHSSAHSSAPRSATLGARSEKGKEVGSESVTVQVRHSRGISEGLKDCMAAGMCGVVCVAGVCHDVWCGKSHVWQVCVTQLQLLLCPSNMRQCTYA